VFVLLFHAACQPGQIPQLDGRCLTCPFSSYTGPENTYTFNSLTGPSACIPCAPGTYNPSKLVNAGFENDYLPNVYVSSTSPPFGWSSTSNAIVNIVASTCGTFGGMQAQSGNQFVALSNAGSGIIQVVYPNGPTAYSLTFYAAGCPGSTNVCSGGSASAPCPVYICQDGVAPLTVRANGITLGTVTPILSRWTLYQFQFAVPNASAFSLQFAIDTGNAGLVSVFLDTIMLTSNSTCAPCTVSTCAAGYYLSDGVCGGVGSCVLCPPGSFCNGGTTAATACPARYTSVQGSKYSSDCFYNSGSTFWVVKRTCMWLIVLTETS
jgi:hypothetical protein